MSWPLSVKEKVLVKSGRHCCICHKFCGIKIELHHITLKSEGGLETEENCIRGCANVNLINRGINKLEEISNDISRTSQILNLAGNKTRLKILYLVKTESKVCVCDLSDILGMNVSAISQHLKKMKDKNLLETEREAQTIFYSLIVDYEKMLNPFFERLSETAILQS